MGLIGCGTIGSALARVLRRPPLSGEVRLVAVCDLHRERAAALARRFRPGPRVVSMEELVRGSDWVLEAASPSAIPLLLRMAIRNRKHLFVMSTAGLLESPGLLRRARKVGCRISIPSGALIGVDGLKAFAKSSLQKVTLTTRKPPRSFNLNTLRRPKLLFEGPALKAVRAFPQNINVAATVLLAGIPPEKFRVRILADPSVSRNIHELSVTGREGRFVCRAENLPSKNPKTSRLAILSAVAALRQMVETMHVGT